jgi:GDPmannose 4,6-dehydratase
MHYGDLSDGLAITRIIKEVQPHEIYNLAAQSHVGVSFDNAEYTSDIDSLGALRILESIRLLGLSKSTKFYQASTSEMFGLAQESPQNEKTPFYPRSPYAVSKVYSYWITVNFREAYGIYACNGILFNHESPRRGENFITRKITKGLAEIACGLDKCLYVGNLDALRDWGHARDYVKMQWLMLQQEEPDDFVIASGKQHSVRDFVDWSARELGITLEFVGSGLQEIAKVKKVSGDTADSVKVGDTILRVDKRYFRPTETDSLLGDASKAKKILGWSPTISAQELCAEMVKEDLKAAQIKLHNLNSKIDKKISI